MKIKKYTLKPWLRRKSYKLNKNSKIGNFLKEVDEESGFENLPWSIIAGGALISFLAIGLLIKLI